MNLFPNPSSSVSINAASSIGPNTSFASEAGMYGKFQIIRSNFPSNGNSSGPIPPSLITPDCRLYDSDYL